MAGKLSGDEFLPSVERADPADRRDESQQQETQEGEPDRGIGAQDLLAASAEEFKRGLPLVEHPLAPAFRERPASVAIVLQQLCPPMLPVDSQALPGVVTGAR